MAGLPAEREPYQRQFDEPADAYSLFKEFCKIPPSSRTLKNLANRTSIPIVKLSRLARLWQWEMRAIAFDHDSLELRPDPRSMDEEAALAGQLVASTIMLDIGLQAIQAKNPSLIPVSKAVELVKAATEIQRKALGVADVNIKVTHDDMNRLNKVIEDIGILDAEIVSEESDDGGVDGDA